VYNPVNCNKLNTRNFHLLLILLKRLMQGMDLACSNNKTYDLMFSVIQVFPNCHFM